MLFTRDVQKIKGAADKNGLKALGVNKVLTVATRHTHVKIPQFKADSHRAKEKNYLMFEIISLIFFACSVIYFMFAFARRGRALT